MWPVHSREPERGVSFPIVVQVGEVTVSCPGCAQRLVVPTHDLRLTFVCPRCRATWLASQLIPATTPVSAIPVVETPPPVPGSPPILPLAEPLPAHSREPTTQRLPQVSPQQQLRDGSTLILPAVTSQPAGGNSLPARLPDFEEAPTPPPAPTATASSAAATGAQPVLAFSSPPNIPEQRPMNCGTALPVEQSSPAANLAGVGRAGAQAAVVAGDAALRFSSRLDALLGGRRFRVLAYASLLVMGAPVLDGFLQSAADLHYRVFSILAPLLFVLLIGVVVVARIDALRDGDGWQSALLASQVKLAWGAVEDWFDRVVSSSSAQRAIDIGQVVFGVGLFLTAVISLATSWTYSEFWLIGLVPYSAGLALAIWGRYKLKEQGSKTGLIVAPEQRTQLTASINALPPVLDGSDKDALAHHAERSFHPLTSAVLDVLSKWRPRGCSSEKEFQAKLLAKLVRELPHTEPAQEVWIDKAARVDLVLGQSLIIEMKVAPGTPELDRAESQVKRYLQSWQKGPIVLLILRSSSNDIGARVGSTIAELRRAGYGAAAIIGP